MAGSRNKIKAWHDYYGDLRSLINGNAEWDQRHKDGPLCFGYVRVSTIDQATGGHSIQAQKAVIQSYYDSKLMPQGIVWGEFFDDGGYSAKEYHFTERPAARKMIEACRQGDHIVVAVFDRAFRSVQDFANTTEILRNLGVTIHPLNAPGDPSKPEGRLMLNMLASFAQFESELKGARVRATHQFLRNAGKAAHDKLGYLPIKETGGKLVPCWDTRLKMAVVVRARNSGKTFTQIANEMPEAIMAVTRVLYRTLQDTQFYSRKVRKNLTSMTGLRDKARNIYCRWFDLVLLDGDEWVKGIAPDLVGIPDLTPPWYRKSLRADRLERHGLLPPE